MKTNLLNKQKKFLLFILIASFNFSLFSQSTPFNCDFNAYLFQFNDVYALDLASGSSYQVATDITPGNINATGYNPADGYIWGYTSNPAKTIVRIGKNFFVDTFHVPQLSGSNMYVGDIDTNGIYYLKGGGTSYYTIDLNPNSTNYTKYISSGTLSKNLSIADWAFNSVDGQLYTVERSTNHLYRINPSSSFVTDLGEVPVLNGLSYSYGAVYFDSTGQFYISANQTGTIYIVNNVQAISLGDSISSNLFAFGPSSSSNDGARCPTAPVPQEDCLNGIDDDGDGLIDCNDPSCSGVSSCPVIVAPVSGGSGGGLESNDRLSQQINQRNYLRSKANFTFDASIAPVITKSAHYMSKNPSRSGFSLRDLIPLSVLDGTTAIESSPSDLINMTNATELFSVDYMKENEPIAVILATKTENGVYEHTKYICDRLLGAELISVSTITINDQTFIKSIIKNNDGSTEFVLSFSGKVVNNGSNFEIESHWNIDRYEDSVTFYNFQIWSNKIDDLLLLGEETLALFEAQLPISNYNNSSPPPVFVKKGKYVNGSLELELINTSACKKIQIDAGFKRTETSETEKSSTEVALEDGYITSLILETGYLFDIGFRISNDRNETADDLFMADGPWGVDETGIGTELENYEVLENDSPYNGYGKRIERNVNLKASVVNYIAVYKAFTPRFSSIDLSQFNTVAFNASGTGTMEITIVKKGIKQWENQFRTSVQLTKEKKEFAIPYSLFKSNNHNDLDLRDAISIVFTLSSGGQKKVVKSLELNDLEFVFQDKIINSPTEVLLAPNPANSLTILQFFSEAETDFKLTVYNTTGKLIKSQEGITSLGNNKVLFDVTNFRPGIYLLNLSTTEINYKPIKLIIN